MRFHLLCVLLCIPAFLRAQQPPPSRLGEVIVLGTRINDSVSRAPAAITVLRGGDIVRQGFADISQAVNTVPGVLMQSAALNTNRISIRGIGARTPFGTNRIRAFYGPIPLTSGDGETTIDDLDMEGIGSVEFIRGPHASLYGAGLAGAILISPATSPQKFQASANTTHGSYGMQKSSYSAGARGFGIRHHKLSLDGWRQNSQYSREGTTITADLPAGANSRFLILGNHTSLKAYIPSSLNIDDFNQNPQNAAPAWLAAKGFEQYDMVMAGVGFERTAGKIRPSVAAFASAKDAYEPRPFDILAQKSLAMGVRGQALAAHKIGNIHLRMIAGAEYFNDNLDSSNYENLFQNNNGEGSLQGDNIFSAGQNRNFINGFAQAAADIGPWGVRAGINLNHTRLKSNGDQQGNHDFGAVWSPEFSVNYTIPAGMLYLSFGKGFSLPSVSETLDASRNLTRLRPETGLNCEAGGKFNFLSRRLIVEAALFTMHVRDLLVARRIADDQYVGINAGRTRHQGLEVMAKYSSAPAAFTFSGYLSGSAGKFTFIEFIERENNFSGNKLTGVPDLKISAGGTLKHKTGLFVDTDVMHMGAIPANDANTAYSKAFSTVHCRLGILKTLIPNLETSLLAGVNNLFDHHYASMLQVNALAVNNAKPRYFYPGQPRNFYVQFAVRYEL